MNATKLNFPPRPIRAHDARPRRYFLLDGRPAEQCGRCSGTGYVQAGIDHDDPCPARCADGLVPATGLRAAVLLLESALEFCVSSSGTWLETSRRISAAKSLIEDIACERCASDKTEPESWR